MCILLKLDYAKFGVSNEFFQKLSTHLGKGKVKEDRCNNETK